MPPRSGRPSDDPFPARTVVGERYITLKRLGHGGYGVVYQALQQELETHVVLKFLKREHHGLYDRIQQFKLEAHAPGKIRTGVVKCLDYYEELDGYPCQVLEYIHGPNLRTHLDKEGGQLSYETALQIALQLARTMQAAHRVGIVHRDLTPGNIMLTDERLSRLIRAKVIDWGIAAWFGEGHTSTHAPEGAPPPPYLPPEDINQVRPAYDLFTFGVVLYQMLVGQPPEPTSFASTKLALGALAAPLGLYPPSLRKLLAQCLQQSPHDRPSAEDAHRIIEQLVFEEEQRPVRELREQFLQATGKLKLLEEQADQQRKRADDETDQVTALIARLEAAERSHDLTKDILRQREQANAGFAHQNEKLRASLEAVNNQLYAAEREREVARSDLDSALKTVTALQETARRSEGRVKELEARADGFRKELEVVRDGFQRQRTELMDKLRESEEAARMSRTERERQLNADVTAYLSQLDQQRSEIERQQAQLRQANLRAQELEAERSQLQAALLSAHAAVSKAAISRRSPAIFGGLGVLLGTGLSFAAFLLSRSQLKPTALATVQQDASVHTPDDIAVSSGVLQMVSSVDLSRPGSIPAPPKVGSKPQWRTVTPHLPGQPLRILDLWADARNIYAVGEQCSQGCASATTGSASQETTRGVVLRSVTKGASWEEVSLPVRTTHLYAVRGDKEGNLYIGGDGVLFRLNSSNIVRIPIAWPGGPGRQVLRDVFVPTSGMNGIVFAVSAAPGGHLFSVRFPAQGEPQTFPIKLPTGDSLQGIDGDENSIWVVGTGGAVVRVPHERWSVVPRNIRYLGMLRGSSGEPLSPFASHETFYKVRTSDEVVTICGAIDVPGQVRRGVFYRTKDRGKHWTRTGLDIPCYAQRELDSGDILLAGYGKKLVRIKASGQTLDEQVPTLTETSNAKALWGSALGDLWVAGWSGLFLAHTSPASVSMQ